MVEINVEELEAQAEAATPWPEIRRLARAATTDREMNDLAERLLAERPYLGGMAGAYLVLGTAAGSPEPL